jgi:hypothetical protein
MNIEEVLQYFQNKGYPEHIAAGIAGNLGQESSLNPNAINPKSGAFGLAQWLGPRKESLQQFAQQQGSYASDPGTQLDFIHHELNTTEKRARDALMKAQSPAEAAVAFSNKFERAGVNERNNERRVSLAEKAMNFIIPTASADETPYTNEELAKIAGVTLINDEPVQQEQPQDQPTYTNEELAAIAGVKLLPTEDPQAPNKGNYGLNMLRGLGGEVINRINAIPGFGEDIAPVNDTQWQSEDHPGSGIGKFAGAVATGVPASVMTGGMGVLPQVGLQSALEMLMTPGGLKERGIAGAGSVIGGTILPAALGAGKYLADVGGSLTAPFRAGGREKIVSKFLNNLTGDNTDDIIKRLEDYQTFVPGTQPTAAEVANSGGISAVQRWAQQANTEPYTHRAGINAAARAKAVMDIAGTPAEQEAAKSAREAVTAPLYEAAKAQVVNVDDQLANMFSRPSMKTALNNVKAIAAERGQSISSGLENVLQGKPGTITGDELHQLKISLDDVLRDPANPLAKTKAAALKSTIKEFEAWREAKIPVYAQAQKAYQELSKPIGQQQIGGALYDKLKPALTGYSEFEMPRETAQTFARALSEGDKIAQKATKFKGATIQNTMTRKQLDTLDNVAKDLARRINADELGRGIGSNTFQNLAMQDMAKTAGVVPAALLKAVSGYVPVLGGAVNALGGAATKNAEQQMKDYLAEVALDPKKMAELMKLTQSPSIMRQLFTELYRPASLVGGALGSQTAKQR